jgi:hypothetical protein
MMRITSDIRLNLGLRLFCFGSETALSRLGAAIAASWLKAELIVGQDSGVPSSLTGQLRTVAQARKTQVLR